MFLLTLNMMDKTGASGRHTYSMKLSLMRLVRLIVLPVVKGSAFSPMAFQSRLRGNLYNSYACLVTHVCLTTVAHSGRSCRPYLHSDGILSVAQLWSERNEKHYRTVQVTEGARLELLLFSHKWNHHHLSDLATSQFQHRNQGRLRHTASVGVLMHLHSDSFPVLFTISSIKLKCPSKSAL